LYAKNKSANYVLHNDVLPFLNFVTKSAWPFSETIIYIHASRQWEQECLEELGIPLNRENDGSSGVEIRTIELSKWAKGPQKLSAAIEINRKDLKKRRYNHQDFRQINVSNDFRHALQSIRCGIPAVLTVRDQEETTRDAEVIELKGFDVPRAFRGILRFENLPQIPSLFALKNWKEEYFGCVNYRSDGNVLDVLAKEGEMEASTGDVQ